MSTGRDDDALSWDGDDDPTLESRGPRAAAADLPAGYTAVGRGSESSAKAPTESAAEPDVAEHPASASNAALVSLGILGGIYLLYTLGWVIGGLRLQAVAAFLVAPVAFVPFFWLAVLAPAIWFAATLLLTRGSAGLIRFVWLVAGALLLVPWPFILVGAVGAT